MASNLSRFRGWAKKWTGTKHSQRQTEVTVETRRFLVIRRRQMLRGWCQECGCDVDMVGMPELERVSGMSALDLRDSNQAGTWHFCKAPDGTAQICLESLLRSA